MEDAHQEHSPLDHILNALLNEAVRSRIRNRALLRVLVGKGTLEMQEYIEAYRAEEEQNFGVLVEMLMSAPEDFRREHADWLARDRATFGYNSESYPSVHLSPGSDPHAAEDGSGLPATTPVKKKNKTRRKKS